jgi:hypothetical protein
MAILEPISPIEFAQLVWRISAVARHAGLYVPAFRDAPEGVVRHLRRRVGRQGGRPEGEVVVVVPVRGHSRKDVEHDIVEGLLAVNRTADAHLVEAFIASLSIGLTPQTTVASAA